MSNSDVQHLTGLNFIQPSDYEALRKWKLHTFKICLSSLFLNIYPRIATIFSIDECKWRIFSTHQVGIYWSSATDVRSSAFTWMIDLENFRLPKHTKFVQVSQSLSTRHRFTSENFRLKNEKYTNVRIRIDFSTWIWIAYVVKMCARWLTKRVDDRFGLQDFIQMWEKSVIMTTTSIIRSGNDIIK